MKEEDGKNFSMGVPVMLEEGQRFLNQYLERPTDFTNVFNKFKMPFATNMQDAIDICYASTTDEISKRAQHIQTEKVDGFVATGRSIFQGGIEYIKIAFPGKKSILNLFGQPEYEKARSSHLLMPVLLMQAYTFAIDPDNSEKLIAEGMTLLKIEEFKTTALAINEGVQKQKKLMGARTLSTQDRTNNLNAVWAMMVLLSDCAKQIYKDNPAMWNLYLLYPAGAPPPPPPPDPPIGE